MFAIQLQTRHAKAPHIWKEGGEFITRHGAEFHAKQIRHMNRTEKLYTLIKVVKLNGTLGN